MSLTCVKWKFILKRNEIGPEFGWHRLICSLVKLNIITILCEVFEDVYKCKWVWNERRLDSFSERDTNQNPNDQLNESGASD